MFEIDGQVRTNMEPIGGWAWLHEHRHDHSHAEIGALTLEISFCGQRLSPVNSTVKRGTVKSIVRGLR